LQARPFFSRRRFLPFVPATPLFFTFGVSIARFQLPLRIRVRLLIGTPSDTAISVKFLVSSAFLRYSAFLRFLRRFLIVQAKQKVTIASSLVTVL
jgi:hypothetical protein